MSTTLALIARVREKVDEPLAAFWSDALITNQLNESYRFYWAFILKLHEGYFVTTSQISFDKTKIDGAYDLPADFFKARLVSRNLPNAKAPLRYFERFEDSFSTTIDTSSYNLPNYRFRGSKIVFEPAPSFDETNAIELEYTKSLTEMGAGTDDEFAGIPMAEDCLVLRAVIKCKGIEEMVAGGGVDVDPFIKDLLTTEQLLKEAVEERTTARQYVQQFGEDDNNLI